MRRLRLGEREWTRCSIVKKASFAVENTGLEVTPTPRSTPPPGGGSGGAETNSARLDMAQQGYLDARVSFGVENPLAGDRGETLHRSADGIVSLEVGVRDKVVLSAAVAARRSHHASLLVVCAISRASAKRRRERAQAQR
eukprot:301647-Rhodomonas_salina.2